MSFGQAVSSVFSKYATFSGRARRSEFWYWVLFVVPAQRRRGRRRHAAQDHVRRTARRTAGSRRVVGLAPAHPRHRGDRAPSARHRPLRLVVPADVRLRHRRAHRAGLLPHRRHPRPQPVRRLAQAGVAPICAERPATHAGRRPLARQAGRRPEMRAVSASAAATAAAASRVRRRAIVVDHGERDRRDGPRAVVEHRRGDRAVARGDLPVLLGVPLRALDADRLAAARAATSARGPCGVVKAAALGNSARTCAAGRWASIARPLAVRCAGRRTPTSVTRVTACAAAP